MERVRAGFGALFLLVAVWKTMFFLVLHTPVLVVWLVMLGADFGGDNLGFDGAERHMAHYC